ncbi:hypothetical protein BDV24DRAFT_145923, partial [Aspergillus arachidicola]
MHRPRYHRTPAYLQDPGGSATGSAALGSSSAESRTETGSEISGGLPVGARAAPRAEDVRSGGTSAAARDAPDDSVMEGLKFTGNTPPNETNSPVDTIPTESTLSSVPTLPSTLPATATRQSIASSTTEGTRRSLRLVNRIDCAIMQIEPPMQARSLSPRKRRRPRDSLGPDTEIRGRTRSATTTTSSTLNH